MTARPAVDVAILCYPGSQAASIFGLTDLFTYADYFARMHAAGVPATVPQPAAAHDEPFLRVTHWRERADASGLECEIEGDVGSRARPSIVILPACQLGPPKRGGAPATAAWVAELHAGGAVIAAVCGGVFVLAETGLLDGRRVTTHWKFAAELRQRFPALRLEVDRILIDEQDIMTAGGVLAWVDMGLTLVERSLGPTLMSTTAKFMLVEPPGRDQRLYDEFAPSLVHGDRAVLSIQHWLQANVTAESSVADLAERAGLGSRTFLRRFVKATGLKPTEYRQRLRIARSRELLEFTRDTIDEVALAAGYDDTRGFRRAFKRVIGLSPAEYRRRFRRNGVSSATASPGA